MYVLAKQSIIIKDLLFQQWLSSQFFGVWDKETTVTVATGYHRSLLLKARPEFLGAARSGGINVFEDLLRLSGLVSCFNQNHLLSPTYQNSGDDSENYEGVCNKYGSEQLNQAQRKQNQAQTTDITELDTKITNSAFKCNSLAKKTYVVDRLEDGSEIQVPFTFNLKTRLLFKTLEEMNIPFETEIYKPRPKRLKVDKNIFYCKNLFLKDRKGQFFLVICHEDYETDLKKLRKSLNAYRNFNFGTADDMKSLLDTEPGGVTPLALMNSSAADVRMVIHESLTDEEAFLMFHPMDSDLATKLTLPSLLKFLRHFHHNVTFVQ